jgi:hypothetical protein
MLPHPFLGFGAVGSIPDLNFELDASGFSTLSCESGRGSLAPATVISILANPIALLAMRDSETLAAEEIAELAVGYSTSPTGEWNHIRTAKSRRRVPLPIADVHRISRARKFRGEYQDFHQDLDPNQIEQLWVPYTVSGFARKANSMKCGITRPRSRIPYTLERRSIVSSSPLAAYSAQTSSAATLLTP